MTTLELLVDATDRDVDDLAALLVDTVEGGASVGFLLPLDHDEAAAWWREVLADELTDTWVARDDDGADRRRRAPHPGVEAELAAPRRDLQAHGRAAAPTAGSRVAADGRRRARGLGRADLRLLLLDTETDSPAQPFYVARGWRVVGVIEDYAATPYGEPAATTILELRRPG